MAKMSTERMREYMRVRRLNNRSSAVDHLGGCCCKCGQLSNLEFDHIDPSTKVNEIASMLHLPWTKLLVELEKCQLLCEECHQEKTSAYLRENSNIGVHGTISNYKYCKCDLCRKAGSDYAREYMRQYRKIKPRKRKR